MQVYCQPGSLNNCFAFAITSADGHLTYYVQNLQGAIQPGGATFDINRIMLADRAVDGSSVIFSDGAPRIAAAEARATLGSNLFFADNSISTFQRTYTLVGGLGVIGCENRNLPLGGPDATNFVVQTCLPAGLDGWARFDVDAAIRSGSTGASRPATLDDFYVQIAGCDLLVGAQSGATPRGANCSTNINHADLRASFTTVPEPTSIALVASGLVGTGLFGRRRRKA